MQVTRQVYAPGLVQARHAHGVTTCSMVLSGTLRERVGSREVVAGPLSIVLKPLDTEHSDAFGAEPVHLIRISLSEADSRNVRETLPAGGRWRWTAGGTATRTFVSLLRESTDPDAHDAHTAERLVWDTLAALLSSAEDGCSIPPAWLARVREELDDSADPPRLAALASAAGVHPVYLARQFRRFYGCSVSGYIHRSRIRRAAELMTVHRVPLARAAAGAGFADQAHMCRVFRREFGATPAAFRDAATAVRSVQDGSASGR